MIDFFITVLNAAHKSAILWANIYLYNLSRPCWGNDSSYKCSGHSSPQLAPLWVSESTCCPPTQLDPSLCFLILHVSPAFWEHPYDWYQHNDPKPSGSCNYVPFHMHWAIHTPVTVQLNHLSNLWDTLQGSWRIIWDNVCKSTLSTTKYETNRRI